MKTWRGLVMALLLAASLPSIAPACDYCIASQGISPVELGSSGIRYDFRYLHLGDQFTGSTKIANPQQLNETFATHQLSAHYRPADALTISLLIPFCSRSSSSAGQLSHASMQQPKGQQPQHQPSEQTTSREHVEGLADVIFLAKYRLLDENEDDEHPLTLVMSAGMKLPTGKSDVRNAQNEFVDQHLQPGTGSTDFIAGFSLLKAIDSWTLVTTLLGILPTEGTNGYKYGANLNYDLGVRYRLIEGQEIEGSCFGALSILGELRGKESSNGEALENTGGNTTYLAPGLVYFITREISVEASYHHPLFQNLNGTQLGESRRVVAAIQYLF